MRDFLNGLRLSLRGARAHYSTQTPLWSLCVIWEAVSFAWWRGVHGPIADEFEIVCWYHGWGEHRWKARVGDIITVHGVPAVVRSINHRALTVTTMNGTHHRSQCCGPWEPS